jgi:dCTP deaminase
LDNKLLIYEDDQLDMKKLHETREIIIPEEGIILEPHRLYLGKTIEYTRTENLVPMLEGRSSIGRFGLIRPYNRRVW